MEHSHTNSIARFQTQCRSRASTLVATTCRHVSEAVLRAVTPSWFERLRRPCAFFVLGVALPACGGQNASSFQPSDAGVSSPTAYSADAATDAAAAPPGHQTRSLEYPAGPAGELSQETRRVVHIHIHHGSVPHKGRCGRKVLVQLATAVTPRLRARG